MSEGRYELGMNELVYRPALNWSESGAQGDERMLKVSAFTSLRQHVAKYLDRRLRQPAEFRCRSGATLQNTPALYSLMNCTDMSLGTWYPMGGMGRSRRCSRSWHGGGRGPAHGQPPWTHLGRGRPAGSVRRTELRLTWWLPPTITICARTGWP